MTDSRGSSTRLSRRQWLSVTGCGVVAAIGSDGWLIEPNRLVVSSHSLAPRPDNDSIRIVQFTDLHLHDVGHHERAVAARTNALRPDLIALTGDSVDRSSALPPLAEFLDANARIPFVMMLAGHTHSGQLAPFGHAVWRPRGSGRYVSGWYRDPNRVSMYVSRGIGTSVVPIRLGAVPEIAGFEL
jgi:predicted MPP superfamily phosphohydrolase